MPFSKLGFVSLGIIGRASNAAGNMLTMHGYVTNDAAAVLEAADYFLSIYSQLKVGDVIVASIDVDGTPSVRMYVVTASSSVTVTIARETNIVVGDQPGIADAAAAALSTANTYTDAAVNAAIQVNTDKINAIIAALEASGVTATV